MTAGASPRAIRTLVADDHPLFRAGLRALFGALPDIALVGEAATGAEAIARAAALAPDVILMDIKMPDLNGIEATRRILAAQPQVGIVVLTMFEDDDLVFAAMRAGARGYILKGADEGELLRAVRAVARGEALFGPAIAARLLGFFAGARSATPPPPLPGLTGREREVLELIAAGHNNQAIAARLFLSPKTVRNHISSIFAKLRVADRAGAIVRAREAGLGHRDRGPDG